MDATIALLNESGRWLVAQLGRMSVELAVLAGIVLAALYVLRVKSPALRHLFWGLLLAKPLVTFLVASPLSLYAFLWPPQVFIAPAPVAVQMERLPIEAPAPSVPSLDTAPSVRSPRPVSPPLWRKIDRYGVASALWALVASVLGLRLLLGCAYVAFLRSTAQTHAEGCLSDLVCETRQSLRMRRRVRIATTTACHGPVLAGIFRPIILLPETMAAALTSQQLRLVITHELAHARRWDNLVLLIQRFAEMFFFFHPVIWFCGWMMRREAEAACDDIVVSAYGDADGATAAAYADSLTRVAEMKCGITRRLLINTFAAAESNFNRRIRRILSGRRTRMTLWLGLATGVALVMIGILGLPTVSSAPPAEKAQARTVAPISYDEVVAGTAGRLERLRSRKFRIEYKSRRTDQGRPSEEQGTLFTYRGDFVNQVRECDPDFNRLRFWRGKTGVAWWTEDGKPIDPAGAADAGNQDSRNHLFYPDLYAGRAAFPELSHIMRQWFEWNDVEGRALGAIGEETIDGMRCVWVSPAAFRAALAPELGWAVVRIEPTIPRDQGADGNTMSAHGFVQVDGLYLPRKIILPDREVEIVRTELADDVDVRELEPPAPKDGWRVTIQFRTWRDGLVKPNGSGYSFTWETPLPDSIGKRYEVARTGQRADDETVALFLNIPLPCYDETHDTIAWCTRSTDLGMGKTTWTKVGEGERPPGYDKTLPWDADDPWALLGPPCNSEAPEAARRPEMSAGERVQGLAIVTSAPQQPAKQPEQIMSAITTRPELPAEVQAALTKQRITATVDSVDKLVEVLSMASGVSFAAADVPSFPPISVTEANPLQLMEQVVEKSGKEICFIIRPYGILMANAGKVRTISGASIPPKVGYIMVQRTGGNGPRPAWPESVEQALTSQPLTLSETQVDAKLSSLAETLSISSERTFVLEREFALNPYAFEGKSAKDVMLALNDMTHGQVCFVLRDYGILAASRGTAARFSGAAIPEDLSWEETEEEAGARPALPDEIKQRLTKDPVDFDLHPYELHSGGDLAKVFGLASGLQLDFDGKAFQEQEPARSAAPFLFMKKGNSLDLMQALVEGTNGALCFVLTDASRVTLTDFEKARALPGPGIQLAPPEPALPEGSGSLIGVAVANVESHEEELHLADGKGALVLDVLAGSPAEAAGIRKRDVIRKVNGTPVPNIKSFVQQIRALPLSISARMEIWRDGAAIELDVVPLPAQKVMPSRYPETSSQNPSGAVPLIVAPLIGFLDEQAKAEWRSQGLATDQAVFNKLQEATMDILRKRLDTVGMQDVPVEKLAYGRIAVGPPPHEDVARVGALAVRPGVLRLLEAASREEAIRLLEEAEKDPRFHGRVLSLFDTASQREPVTAASGDRAAAKAIVDAINSADPKLLPDGETFFLGSKASPDALYLINKNSPLSKVKARSAQAIPDPDNPGRAKVSFKLSDDDAQRFGDLTQSLIGKGLAILLDWEIQSVPVVRDRITQSAQIAANYTPEEAADLAACLSMPEYPVPLIALCDPTSTSPALRGLNLEERHYERIDAGLLDRLLRKSLLPVYDPDTGKELSSLNYEKDTRRLTVRNLPDNLAVFETLLAQLGLRGSAHATPEQEPEKPQASNKSADGTKQTPYYLVSPASGGTPVAVPLEEHAVPASEQKVGKYDRKAIVRDSKELQAAYNDLRTELSAKQAEIDKKALTVQQEKQEYDKVKGALSPQESTARKEHIDALYNEYQADLRGLQDEIDEKEEAILQAFDVQIDQAAKEVGAHRGCSSVRERMTDDPQPSADSTVDITSDILDALSSRLDVALKQTPAPDTSGTSQNRTEGKDRSGSEASTKDAWAAKMATRRWWPAFQKAYGLSEDEILKRIAPPYIPERHKNCRYTSVSPDPSMLSLCWSDDGKLLYEAACNNMTPVLRGSEYIAEKSPADLKTVLRMLNLLEPDLAIASSIEDRKVPGDWSLRNGTPLADLMKRFETILREDLGWRISVSPRQEERDVVVVQGLFRCQPLNGKENVQVYIDDPKSEMLNVARSFCVSVDGAGCLNTEHFFPSSQEAGARPLVTLSNMMGIPFLYDTQAPFDDTNQRGTIWEMSEKAANLHTEPDSDQKNANLARLLQNIEKQTGFRLSHERRARTIWHVEEQ